MVNLLEAATGLAESLSTSRSDVRVPNFQFVQLFATVRMSGLKMGWNDIDEHPCLCRDRFGCGWPSVSYAYVPGYLSTAAEHASTNQEEEAGRATRSCWHSPGPGDCAIDRSWPIGSLRV